MIEQNSLEAFEKVLPKIGERQSQILKELKWGIPLTDCMIGKSLHLPINCITNRRGELRKKGLITEVQVDKCKITGNRASYWGLTEKGKQVNEFKEKFQEVK